MIDIKLHCGKPVTLVSDFGEFFFMCEVCQRVSNRFDSYKESPDLIELKRIQFRKAKGAKVISNKTPSKSFAKIKMDWRNKNEK